MTALARQLFADSSTTNANSEEKKCKHVVQGGQLPEHQTNRGSKDYVIYWGQIKSALFTVLFTGGFISHFLNNLQFFLANSFVLKNYLQPVS